jgi:hypothetical protein
MKLYYRIANQLRERFLSVRLFNNKKFNHREHRVHRGFSRFFLRDLGGLCGVMPLRNSLLIKSRDYSRNFNVHIIQRSNYIPSSFGGAV